MISRIQLLIAFFCVALLVYFAMLTRTAVALIHTGSPPAVALGIGVLGYHHFAGLPWIDSLLNASMILTGMGPIDPMRSDAAKLFASLYALFSGVVFLTAVALLLSPIFHRLLHHFHLDDESQ